MHLHFFFLLINIFYYFVSKVYFKYIYRGSTQNSNKISKKVFYLCYLEINFLEGHEKKNMHEKNGFY